MDKKFMEKTTFAEIYKLVKDGNEIEKKVIKSVLNVGLLLFPGFVCPELKLISDISNGVDLIAAKDVLVDCGKCIKDLFSGDKASDFVSRYERVQLAQVLLVFSAYFDSMRMYLPDKGKVIALSETEKIVITQEAINEYEEWLKNRDLKNASSDADEISKYALDFQAPLESDYDFRRRLVRFYELLNKQFLAFYEKLSFFEQLSETNREAFMTVIRNLPQAAFDNYKKQYYELKTVSHDFEIWAVTKEHDDLREQIDIGFKKTNEKYKEILDYIETKNNTGADTLNKFKNIYDAYINKPLIETDEIGAGNIDGVVFPAKKDIFIPQSFKALRVMDKNLVLESRKTWGSETERDDVGVFIAETLRHSETGKYPLLILGVPGAGKTLLSHMLAAQILSHEYYVVIIKLREVNADDSIIGQIENQINGQLGTGCRWNDFSGRNISKPLLLIFDGFDELLQATGRTYADYIKKIHEFQETQYEASNIKVKCIITSRVTLIDKAVIPLGTTVIRLSDFNDKRIDEWIKVWNHANNIFFTNNSLEEFSINPSSKVYELAQQPLLLLLLALYDSDNNALKKNEDLNSAQLYEQLIRAFVVREQKKSSEFMKISEDKQKIIIDSELEKISIAALGMYNRRVLFIRSPELEADLRYLLSDHNERTEGSIPDGLANSEKLLGSFFFIHRSDAMTSKQQPEAINTAYEFLHNTFGEFLTAYYIVKQLQNVVRKVIGFKQLGFGDFIAKEEEKGWFVALSYAPISSRPVVAKMIKEFASDYEVQFQYTQEQIISAIGDLLDKEIDSIIKGDKIDIINAVLSDKENKFEKDEYLTHLACYALNILSLGALVCGEDFEYCCTNKVWNKLICLWKYAFSEEELLDVASIFKANREGDSWQLRYAPEEDAAKSSTSKVLRIKKVNEALGDTVTSSLVSAALGDGETKAVLNELEWNELGIEVPFLINKYVNVLALGRETTELAECFYYLQRSISQGVSVKDLCVFYSLLDYVLLNKRRNSFNVDYFRALEAGIEYINESTPRTIQEEEVLTRLQEILCSIIKNIYIVDYKSLLRMSMHAERTPLISLSIIQRLLTEPYEGRIPRSFIYGSYIEKEIISLGERIIEGRTFYKGGIYYKRRNKNNLIAEYFSVVCRYLKNVEPNTEQEVIHRIYSYIEFMCEKRFAQLGVNYGKEIDTVRVYAEVLGCIKQIMIRTRGKESLFIREFVSRAPVLELFEHNRSAIYDLCDILSKIELNADEDVVIDLRKILQFETKKMSRKMRYEINKVLEKVDKG